MFQYNLKLALKSLRSRVGLTALMAITIGIGIGLLMTMVTIAYQSQKIPFLGISESLYMVQMDSRHAAAREVTERRRMVNLTYRDAMNLYNAQTPASAQTFNFKVLPILAVDDQSTRPIQGIVDATTASFFTMFDAKFIYGQAWDKSENNAPVVVITKEANDTLFGGQNSVGKTLTVGSAKARVVGVLDDWNAKRRVFDGTFTSHRMDDAFVPYQFAIDANMPRWQRMRCHPQEYEFFNEFVTTDIEGLMNSECTWVNFWAKIESSEQAEQYFQFTEQYVTEQKEYGRFVRPIQNYVTNIDDQVAGFVQNGWNRELNLLAKLFFFVCLVNAVGMLLTKFLSGSKEVSLRRALGAKKQAIMGQHLMEVSIIGVLGGVVGVFVSLLGLHLMKHVRMYATDFTADMQTLNHAYQLDWTMAGVAIAVAIISTVVVGLYPILRIVNVSPASQLKGA